MATIPEGGEGDGGRASGRRVGGSFMRKFWEESKMLSYITGKRTLAKLGTDYLPICKRDCCEHTFPEPPERDPSPDRIREAMVGKATGVYPGGIHEGNRSAVSHCYYFKQD